MAKHRDLAYNDRLPESFLDALTEYISTYLSPNFDLSLANSTTLQVVAGAGNGGNDEVCAGLMGKWRWITATVNAAHPGGGAATYDVFITATDNNFVVTGGTPPETDSTVYTFGLQILASGAFPATALYRKIGTCVWSGTAITDFSLTASSKRHHGTHEPGGSDPISLTAMAVATTLVGTLGARPAAAAANSGFTYFATDNLGGTIYRSNGAAWAQVAAGVVHAAVHLPGAADPLDWGGTIHARGTLAARPAAAAGNSGLFYFATDALGGTVYRSTGAAWEKMAPGATEALTPGPHAASHLAAGTDALAWTTIHGAGTLAARPAAAAANAGYEYLATDVNGGTIYRSDGAAWTQKAAGVNPDPSSFNRAGTWAARPLATAVLAGTLYYVTDEPGKPVYRSDGTNWVRVSISDPIIYYSEKVADQGLNNVTTDATADTVLTSGLINFKQTTFIELVGGGQMRTTDNGFNAYLFITIDGVTQILVSNSAGGNAQNGPYRIGSRRVSVVAGDHTFALKARNEGATAGTPGRLIAGDGSVASGTLPAFIQVEVK